MKLITVGKLKDKHLEAIENQYLKRIRNPKIELIELKANAENKEAEADAILKKIESKDFVVTLTEQGKQLDSIAFSQWLSRTQNLVLVICGAEGPGSGLLKRSDKQLSLSQLTFPHKLARIVLVEQIYRA